MKLLIEYEITPGIRVMGKEGHTPGKVDGRPEIIGFNYADVGEPPEYR